MLNHSVFSCPYALYTRYCDTPCTCTTCEAVAGECGRSAVLWRTTRNWCLSSVHSWSSYFTTSTCCCGATSSCPWRRLWSACTCATSSTRSSAESRSTATTCGSSITWSRGQCLPVYPIVQIVFTTITFVEQSSRLSCCHQAIPLVFLFHIKSI